jgi:hypothetical protein
MMPQTKPRLQTHKRQLNPFALRREVDRQLRQIEQADNYLKPDVLGQAIKRTASQ